jgi:hypothetical protein
MQVRFISAQVIEAKRIADKRLTLLSIKSLKTSTGHLKVFVFDRFLTPSERGLDLLNL